MQQQELFNQTRSEPAARPAREVIQPRSCGAETSTQAAEAVKPHAGRLRDLVYSLVEARGGATDEEIARALELLSDTARARRCELRDAGYLVDSGDRRPTSRGRPAVVWKVTDKTFPGK
ncbi:MAG: hypothetical protein O3C40_29685 [Planctomycetota bacterium]|nr:hypothetical protein [Planctomycetota bacterium]